MSSSEKKWAWSEEAKQAQSKRMKLAWAKKRGVEVFEDGIGFEPTSQTKNITVDASLQDELNNLKERFRESFGFVPTHSQIIAYLIKTAEV